MIRLRNARTGAVVSCSDATAARLGSEWQPVEQRPKRAAKRTSKKAAQPAETD